MHIIESSLSSFVSEYIDGQSSALRDINLKIHSNPELAWKEVIAVDTLCSYLEHQQGWKVERGVYGIATAFVAEYQSSNKSSRDGSPRISFNAEYGMSGLSFQVHQLTRTLLGVNTDNSIVDALPEIGHACGHNLIATGSLATAMTVATAMERFQLGGRIFLIGTPAEESGMIDALGPKNAQRRTFTDINFLLRRRWEDQVDRSRSVQGPPDRPFHDVPSSAE